MKTVIVAIACMFSVYVKAQSVNDLATYQPQLSVLQKTETIQPGAVSTDGPGNSTTTSKNSKTDYILKVLDVFGELSTNEVYQITIAADVPDNKRPGKVFYKKEPGHVFIILEKKDTITHQSISKAWGFYPIRPVSSIFFKKTKSILTDNSKREYNAAITKILSKEEFNLVKLKAANLAEKKYHINRYNCYDYAIEIFNSLPGIEILPITHVKFPFIFGSGGSPCGLYADLVKLKNTHSVWAGTIRIGNFTAPENFLSNAAGSVNVH